MMAGQEEVPPAQDAAPSILIERPALTHQAFSTAYNIHHPTQPPIKDKVRTYFRRHLTCSGKCVLQTLLHHVPCVELLKNYQWKQWFVADLVSGLSVGVIHIPQGMGFALLTNLPAIYGLYASIFPLWVYFIFGTSRHISVGTMALISLMIGAVVTSQAEAWLAVQADQASVPSLISTTLSALNSTQVSQSNEDEALTVFKVDVAMSVTLLMGVFQLAMWLVRLHVLATYMSMAFVSAFMTGAACHIITSQVPALFGLHIEKFSGTFSLPKTYIEVFKNIAGTNVASLLTGLVCIGVLLLLKEVVNDRFKKLFKVPIPGELIVVIIGTIISHFAKFNERFGVKVIGSIPRGIPAPSMPSLQNASDYLTDCIVLAIVGFAISISMAKLISKRQGYSIDPNQELLAYGLKNAIGSFFNSFGGAQAPPRSLVCENTGGKTQMSGLISTVLPLLVCLALGPLFQSLPNCVLGAIIIVALMPLLKTLADMPRLWRLNKIDLAVYLMTLLSSVFVSIVVGLVVGMGGSVLLVVVQMQFAKLYRVKAPSDTEVYLPEHSQTTGQDSQQLIQVFRFDSDLLFVNVDSFKQKLFEKAGHPSTLAQENPQNGSVSASVAANHHTSTEDMPLKGLQNTDDQGTCSRAIILDCSTISYIDIMGLNLLSSLRADYAKSDTQFALAGCGETLLAKLQSAELVAEQGSLEEDSQKHLLVFPSVSDAVHTFNSRNTAPCENYP